MQFRVRRSGDAVNERINHAIQQWKTGSRVRVTGSHIYIYIYMRIRWHVWIRSIGATYQRWTCQSPMWRCSWQCSAETLLTCRISLPWIDEDASLLTGLSRGRQVRLISWDVWWNMNRDWEGERRKKKKKEANSLSGYWLIRGFVFRWWTGICCKSIRDIKLRCRG